MATVITAAGHASTMIDYESLLDLPTIDAETVKGAKESLWSYGMEPMDDSDIEAVCV